MSPNDYTPATETDYLFAEDMAPAVRGAEGRVEWLRQQVQRLAGTSSGCGRGLVLSCLGTTLSGAPKHPLARGQHRIPDDQEPMQWWPSENATPPGQTGGDR